MQKISLKISLCLLAVALVCGACSQKRLPNVAQFPAPDRPAVVERVMLTIYDETFTLEDLELTPDEILDTFEYIGDLEANPTHAHD